SREMQQHGADTNGGGREKTTANPQGQRGRQVRRALVVRLNLQQHLRQHENRRIKRQPKILVQHIRGRRTHSLRSQPVSPIGYVKSALADGSEANRIADRHKKKRKSTPNQKPNQRGLGLSSSNPGFRQS